MSDFAYFRKFYDMKSAGSVIGLFVSSSELGFFPDLESKLEQNARKMQAVLERYGHVVYPGLVTNEKSADEAAVEFKKHPLDILVVVCATYTDCGVPFRTIRSTNAPILIWNWQDRRSVPEEADWLDVIENSSSAGVPALTNLLIRARRPFAIVSSVNYDEEGLGEIGRYIQSSSVAQHLRNARIGIIGSVPTGMMDLQADEASLTTNLGPMIVHVEENELLSEFQSVPESDALAYLTDISSRCRIEGLTRQELVDSARLALALEIVTKRHELGAIAISHILNVPQIGVVPCLAASRLIELGIVVSFEADPTTAAAMIMLRELAGNAWLLEPLMMDIPHNAIFFMAHGEGDPAFATSAGITLKRRLPASSGVSLEFSAKGGVITLLAIVDNGKNSWRMIITKGEALEITPRPLTVPQMMVRAEKSCTKWFNELCRAGCPHHIAVCYGDVSDQLAKLADILGMEKVIVPWR